MPIIRAIIKPKAIIFLPFELELVQKYEIPYTAAINTEAIEHLYSGIDNTYSTIEFKSSTDK